MTRCHVKYNIAKNTIVVKKKNSSSSRYLKQKAFLPPRFEIQLLIVQMA